MRVLPSPLSEVPARTSWNAVPANFGELFFQRLSGRTILRSPASVAKHMRLQGPRELLDREARVPYEGPKRPPLQHLVAGIVRGWRPSHFIRTWEPLWRTLL
jgi:hypothetical protein